MKNLTIVATLASFLIQPTFSSTLKKRHIDNIPDLYEIPLEKVTEINEIISRHGGGTPRPESCPLERKKY